MSADNVVFLKFENKNTTDDLMAFIACACCRNKTYTFQVDRVGSFPLVKCAACGSHIGRLGWAPDD